MKKIFYAIIMSLVLVLSAVAVSAARLPTVGEDSNQWGTVLNDYLQVSHDENGTLKATSSPTFAGLTLSGNLDLSGNRLIIDSPGPTFSGASSRQTVQADAIFDGFTGGYGAGVMGNAVSGTIGAGNSIIGGVIGKYNLVDSSPSDHPQGAVIGEIGEDVGTTTLPDGAFIAVLGGDTAEVDAGAAYTVRYLNSVLGSQFNYGLYLSGAAIDSYSPVSYATADIKLSKGATIYNDNADTLTITEANIALAGNINLGEGTLTIQEGKLADDSIVSADIKDDTITDSNIADNSLTKLSLAADSVEASELAADSVTSSEIATDAVGADEIATDAVDSAEIKANAVGTDEIAANAVAMADLARGTAGQLIIGQGAGADSVYTSISGDATLVADGTLTIANNAVTTDKINNGAVTNNKIVAAAGIPYSKLTLTNSIVNADVSDTAAIVYSKLNIADGDLAIAKTSGLQTALDLKANLASPTLVTPTLGVASATSINKVAITAPASSATLTIADGKTLTASNTLTFTGTDASSVAFGAGGTVAYTTGSYADPAWITSLAGSKITGDISGNAGTVTNGVYTTGAQTIAGAKTFSSTIVGDISGNAATATSATSATSATTATTATTANALANADATGQSAITAINTATSGTIASARLSESDPKVSTLTNTKWCTSDGSHVVCNTDAPVTSESDPQVGAVTNTKVCVGDGSAVQCNVDSTGSGNVVLATSPTLVTPTLGAASATSLTATDLVKIGTPVDASSKYLQIDAEASAPALGDCDADAEAGRMIVDTSGAEGAHKLYVCTGAAHGWDSLTLTT